MEFDLGDPTLMCCFDRRQLMMAAATILGASAESFPFFGLAAPATRVYVSHSARFVADMPSAWTYTNTPFLHAAGPDGFVLGYPLLSQTLPEATDQALRLLDGTEVGGDKRISLAGSFNGSECLGMVLQHEHPYDFYGTTVRFVLAAADPAHFDGIVQSLSFDPSRVTPEIFLDSVIDLVEGASYWGDALDWSWVRPALHAYLDDARGLASAQSAVSSLIAWLHEAGDNHSVVVFPDVIESRSQLSGFGFLLGGSRIIAVYSDGPAARVGLVAGDVIEYLDGFPPAPGFGGDPGNGFGGSGWHSPATLTVRREGIASLFYVTIAAETFSWYRPPQGRRLQDDLGYVEVPGFRSIGREVSFSDTGNGLVTAIDTVPVNGWIVDLRLNDGGSYSPMVSAVASILGNSTFIGWRTRDSVETWVVNVDGRILDDSMVIADYLTATGVHQLSRPSPPVAVLTGPMTGSAGEVVALSFVGRENTRSFGEKTGGFTTANQTFSLFDGTRLTLAVSAMMDRTGQTHLDGIRPDEPIAIDWATFGTDIDPVLAAAVDWLHARV